VYLPYEKANKNTDEFLFQISVIDSIIDQFSDCHIIVGGDFNTDFSRLSFQSSALMDFCVQSNLHPVCDHSNSSIDYTYNFNMTSFSMIDHFLLSEQLFNTSVSCANILHESDNTSDHDPVCLHLDVSVAKLKCDKREFITGISWDKANALHTEQYKKTLQKKLSRITIPRGACLCEDVLCRSEHHVASLNHYASQITEACHMSAKDAIPMTKPRSESGRIPGWTEFVAPLRAQSIFTALHVMQTRSSDGNSVCLSVRLSVRQTRGL